jgi:uncharacterized protein (DUF1697 family)
MAAVFNANPFPEAEPKYTYAIFLDRPPPRDALDHAVGQRDEEMALSEREIFVHHHGSGMGRSKLRIPAAKTGTARNMNTVAKHRSWLHRPSDLNFSGFRRQIANPCIRSQSSSCL